MTAKPTFIHRKRLNKALMIEAVLQDFLGAPVEGRCIVDIGAGNGEIAEYFQQSNRVSSVDISDRRLNRESAVDFRIVESEKLPFDDGMFDIAISNHVIEHVPNQLLHLDEVRRVLRPGGICYLATPNRTSPFMQEHEGNEQVFYYAQMKPFFEQRGFQVVEYGVECAKHPEKYHIAERTPHWLPEAALRLIRPLFPSHIFILIPERA